MLIASRIPPVCDFCSDPHITRDYACETFDHPDKRWQWGSVGNWAACTQCAALIDAEKWEELADRSIVQYGWLPEEEKPIIREALRIFHREFDRHRPAGKISHPYPSA